MSKYYGKIGFISTEEVSPGVFENVKVERYYKGDVINNNVRWETNNQINDDLNMNVKISIVSDSYIINNVYNIKYIDMAGTLWNVTDIDISSPPRIYLTIGGLYNGG